VKEILSMRRLSDYVRMSIYLFACLLVQSCAEPTIIIEIPIDSPVSVKNYTTLAVAPFLTKKDTMEINEKGAEELVNALEHSKLNLTIIPLGAAKGTIPLPQETISLNEDYFEGWKRIAKEQNVDLLVCGVTDFKSSQTVDYETRTEFNIVTGRTQPVRYQTYQTEYALKTTFYMIDLKEDKDLVEKTCEQGYRVPKIAEEDDVYVFYQLMDETIKIFLKEIEPGTLKTKRFILN
jgi:hypothetical protein